VYLILYRSGTIYTEIALDGAARYTQHVTGTGPRYTRANPPRRLLSKFACPNQSVAGRLEVAIKKLSAAEKRKLVGRTGAGASKLLLEKSRPRAEQLSKVAAPRRIGKREASAGLEQLGAATKSAKCES